MRLVTYIYLLKSNFYLLALAVRLLPFAGVAIFPPDAARKLPVCKKRATDGPVAAR